MKEIITKTRSHTRSQIRPQIRSPINTINSVNSVNFNIGDLFYEQFG